MGKKKLPASNRFDLHPLVAMAGLGFFIFLCFGVLKEMADEHARSKQEEQRPAVRAVKE